MSYEKRSKRIKWLINAYELNEINELSTPLLRLIRLFRRDICKVDRFWSSAGGYCPLINPPRFN